MDACMPAGCKDPQLRVESQVFLLVNDRKALNFISFAWRGHMVDGRPQPMALPEETGRPVTYAGSTTSPDLRDTQCSAQNVTWNVRPQCAKLDINSLNRWARQGNIFKEDHAHGVRPLVTAPWLLSRIR